MAIRPEQTREGLATSVRNGKGAVTNLHRALTDIDKRRLTREALEQWFGDPVTPKEVDTSRIRGQAGAKWRE